ncbi:MAG TPA: lysophospholipid acyltransferase family protein [Thermomicrobiales bacterium]|nr:lysophospholipid acyltransferase family protein [Thermomicrobiales bacterium]
MGRTGEKPAAVAVARRRGPRRRVKFALYQVIRAVVNGFLRLAAGMRTTGARNMPRSGPVIVVANHLHNFDPVVVSAALPRPVFYMSKRELFAHPAFAWLIRNFGAYPVNRGAPDRAALRQTLRLLDEGLVVGLFPEGTRSVTGTLGDAYPGVALVALQAGVPLLPVGVHGTEDLPLDAKAARRPHRGRARVRVVVGRPFILPPRRPGEKPDLDAVTDRIMREIAALLPPEYRGRYAASDE